MFVESSSSTRLWSHRDSETTFTSYVTKILLNAPWMTGQKKGVVAQRQAIQTSIMESSCGPGSIQVISVDDDPASDVTTTMKRQSPNIQLLVSRQ